ncbi:MAG: hypothetical protein GY913_21660 [Proteobacteria bacterium]|nr:hypothetical protein [Actinomycetes bacterium]MCP4919517.1 hypothetical protein [Pseudomonadota bacterium]
MDDDYAHEAAIGNITYALLVGDADSIPESGFLDAEFFQVILECDDHPVERSYALRAASSPTKAKANDLALRVGCADLAKGRTEPFTVGELRPYLSEALIRFTGATVPHSVCPSCETRIDLHDLKDAESFSQVEVYDHIRAQHPELIVHHGKATLFPFVPIHFGEPS